MIKFAVFFRGGPIGSQRMRSEPSKVFDTNEEAKNFAKRMRAILSRGERTYYGMSYVVRQIKVEEV